MQKLVNFTLCIFALLFLTAATPKLWLTPAAPANIVNPAYGDAVPGTPGTIQNWTITSGGGLGTVVVSVVGTGIENGIPFVDVSFVGTSGTGGQFFITNDAIASAGPNQNWVLSGYVSLSAGSFTNIFMQQNYEELSDASGFLANGATAPLTPVAGPLKNGKFSLNYTTTNASTTRHGVYWFISFVNTSVVNGTLRLGMIKLVRKG